MARSALVLPAPLGPMRPTMRPASILKLARSNATCAPYFLVRFFASMSGAMISFVLGFAAGRRGRVGDSRRLGKQFLRGESEPVDDGENLRPILVEEAFALAGQQQPPRAIAHVHAPSAALFDQIFIDQLLIALEHGEGIEPIVRSHRPHGGQMITLLERTLEDEGDHSIAQL